MGSGESTTLAAASSASANTSRRIVLKSEPVAPATQEAVDGYLQKSNEDRKCRTSRVV